MNRIFNTLDQLLLSPVTSHRVQIGVCVRVSVCVCVSIFSSHRNLHIAKNSGAPNFANNTCVWPNANRKCQLIWGKSLCTTPKWVFRNRSVYYECRRIAHSFVIFSQCALCFLSPSLFLSHCVFGRWVCVLVYLVDLSISLSLTPSVSLCIL